MRIMLFFAEHISPRNPFSEASMGQTDSGIPRDYSRQDATELIVWTMFWSHRFLWQSTPARSPTIWLQNNLNFELFLFF